MGIKDIPAQFKIDSEEDLRAMVMSYCSELGFDADEISCEDHFSIRLGHTSVKIEKNIVRGRSDILIARNGKPLAIIETKAPSHELTEEDAQQAISYARLLASIAPFAIVTNGKDTKVYDVFADEIIQIDNPTDSIWHKKGQNILAIGDDIRYEAAKNLIAISPETIEAFCKQQVSNALSDLKSDVARNKKYIPELYVSRKSLNDRFEEWQKSNSSVFAVVAQSGFGKTNFMCAKAEEIVESDYVIFYSSGRFIKGLVDSIKEDFIWEFQRETEAAKILSRLDSIANAAGKRLFIFLDAIDENPSGIKLIKNELLAFVSRIQEYTNVRLVLSCKTFDWQSIVVDGAQSFNMLAESITPSILKSEEHTTAPDANNIGMHLNEFNSKELEEAIDKYKTAFSLDGDFSGELQKECQNPLMLRFVSETFKGGAAKLPAYITSLELFDLYFQRKMEPIENRSLAEIILSKLATLIFTSSYRSQLKGEVISDIAWNNDYETTLQSLLRLGVLSRTIIDEQEKIGFEFNKFLLYFYIFKVKRLNSIAPSLQVEHIQDLAKTLIGVEALDFYFPAVKQETAHEVLVELVKQNLLLAVQIITNLKGIDTYKKSPIPFEQMDNYLKFYNFLRETLFDNLKHGIMPYTDNPLGIILISNRPEIFRSCTSAYPKPFVRVDDPELIKQLFKGPISKKLASDVMPVGAFHLGGIHELAEYPQKASFKHLTREVSNALSNRLLNESKARDILQERVYSILLNEPTFWLEGDDLPHERYWKILGYKSIEDLENAKISDLSNQINDLLNKLNTKNIKPGDSLYLSYRQRSGDLLTAMFTLSQMRSEESLGKPGYSVENLWKFNNRDFDGIIEETYRLMPLIVRNYKILFETNFPSLINHSVFYNNIDKLVLIEVISFDFSDFPALSYIISPNAKVSSPLRIISTKDNKSLSQKLSFNSLYGGGYSQSINEGCGYFKLDFEIENARLYDPEAWAIKTHFPSHTPILDQAYYLILHELKYLLNADSMDWKRDLSHRLANEQYIQLAINLINSKKK